MYVLIYSLVCGIITAYVHHKKGYSIFTGFLWGFFLNVIGLICVFTEMTKEEQEEADKNQLSMMQWLAIFMGIGIGLIILVFLIGKYI